MSEKHMKKIDINAAIKRKYKPGEPNMNGCINLATLGLKTVR